MVLEIKVMVIWLANKMKTLHNMQINISHKKNSYFFIILHLSTLPSNPNAPNNVLNVTFSCPICKPNLHDMQINIRHQEIEIHIFPINFHLHVSI